VLLFVAIGVVVGAIRVFLLTVLVEILIAVVLLPMARIELQIYIPVALAAIFTSRFLAADAVIRSNRPFQFSK
jgi:hypothetical protein